MRARPREINIFNMSLLDILCGALGAFCFMMLVALPYYVAGKPDQAQSQQRTEELMKDVEKLRERMSDPAQAEELRKLIDGLEAQIKQLQGQLNQSTYENEQLKAETSRLTSANNDLAEENQRLEIQHAIDEIESAKRRPFLVLASAIDPTQDVSLFLEDEMVDGATNRKKFANPSFNPETLAQTGWPNDLNVFVPRHGVALWISSTTKPKSIYRLFVKYRAQPMEHTPFGREIKPTRVILSLVGSSVAADHNSAWVNLAPERPWMLAGTLQIDDKGQISYKEASETERDETWRAIMKSDVPTPAPSATPSPTGSLNPDDMQRLRQKAQEERRRIEEDEKARGQQTTPSPASSR